MTITVLNFALLMLVSLGLLFTFFTFKRTHELGMIQPQAQMDQQVLGRIQALVGEVAAYNQKYHSAELTNILLSIQPKTVPAAK